MMWWLWLTITMERMRSKRKNPNTKRTIPFSIASKRSNSSPICQSNHLSNDIESVCGVCSVCMLCFFLVLFLPGVCVSKIIHIWWRWSTQKFHFASTILQWIGHLWIFYNIFWFKRLKWWNWNRLFDVWFSYDVLRTANVDVYIVDLYCFLFLFFFDLYFICFTLEDIWTINISWEKEKKKAHRTMTE